MNISPLHLDSIIKSALNEDLGQAGDVTSQAVIPADKTMKAQFVARENGIVCGLEIAHAVFKTLDPTLTFTPKCVDGDSIKPKQILVEISGNARSILAGERVALNFLSYLSGISTSTHEYATLITHTKARVTCTRKTTPNLRAFEKYAVKIGGGSNHRYNLDSAILIKDNHIAAAGGVTQVLRAAQAYAGHLLPIEIEVDTLEQMQEALNAGAKIILLDNMTPEILTQAVALNKNTAILEASGGVNLTTIKAIAETGVDYISVGKLTTHVKQLDIGLDYHSHHPTPCG